MRTRAFRSSGKIISRILHEEQEEPTTRGVRGRKAEVEAKKKGLERKPVTVVGGVVGKRSAGSRRLLPPKVPGAGDGTRGRVGALSDTRPGLALVTTLVGPFRSPSPPLPGLHIPAMTPDERREDFFHPDYRWRETSDLPRFDTRRGRETPFPPLLI